MKESVSYRYVKMNGIRAFLAIDLSAEIRKNLDHHVGQLRASLPGTIIRWVPVSNIHLTVKFLGDVSVSNLEHLTKILQIEASRHPTFEFSAGELGAFPSNRRPRVIWIGIEAPQELYDLHDGIDVEMQRLGYALEERKFSPHLTLGRVSRNVTSGDIQRISDVLISYKVGFLGAARVQSVNLYRSELNPGGAVYSRLSSAPLAQPAES